MGVKSKSLIVVVIVLVSTFYLASMILTVNVKASTLYVGGTCEQQRPRHQEIEGSEYS